MMIAMVITFTATDTIGGLGGSAESTACGDALNGQCAATSAQYVEVPSTCVRQGQYVEQFLRTSKPVDATDGSGNSVDASALAGGTDAFVSCNRVP
jgi:hypothetical protein